MFSLFLTLLRFHRQQPLYIVSRVPTVVTERATEDISHNIVYGILKNTRIEWQALKYLNSSNNGADAVSMKL